MVAGAGTVVVVDDEPELRDMVCFILSDQGYTVRCLGHPHEATELEEEDEHPDLFVLDLMLPEMNGIDLAKHLRADGFPDTPMIAISASSTMLRAAQNSRLFQDAMPKPFDVDSLLHTVERHIGAGA